MDYNGIYIELMERATDRIIDGYAEKHHIIPRCMGGDDKPRNIAILTPEEHYLAHQLLVKIYPENNSLVYAAQMMGCTRRGNKMYGWLKRKYSETLSERMKGNKPSEETLKKLSKSRKGSTRSEETKRKMSEARKGIVFSEEHKLKLSEARKRRITSDETRAKMSAAQMGNTYRLGKKASDKDRAKRSEAIKKGWATRRAKGQE